MKNLLALIAVLVPSLVFAEPPKPLVTGLKNPTAVAIGPDGKPYVAILGGEGVAGDGALFRIEDGKAVPFASGLDDPRGIAVYMQSFFVADSDRVWRIDAKGKAEVFAAPSAFPQPNPQLWGIVADPESGLLYVYGDYPASIYRITPKGKVDVVLDKKKLPKLDAQPPLALDGASHLLFATSTQREIYRLRLADGSTEKIASRQRFPAGLAWDHHGRLYFGELLGGLFAIPRPGSTPVRVNDRLGLINICYDPSRRAMLVLNYGSREPGGNAFTRPADDCTLTAVPAVIPGEEVDETPMPLRVEHAFPNLQWTGWQGVTDSGKPNPLRPILLTHAGDGSNRVFVPTQHGVIHSFPNDQDAKQTSVFMDISERVKYDDNTNEEGFLGMAFHPKFKDNGEFFVFYTLKNAKLTNIVSRFRVRKNDPTRGDPASEEVLLRFQKPFWNHDGGTICFGPDGYLYITHGDGGLANDPFENGQKLSTHLGKVLRIDVDHKENGKNYAIPKDNPFVNRTDAKPEIWAYGLRNLWRMAFDRKTGQLWAGEVGQNLYEEINIITKGGNYGWNRRESLHPFGPKGVGHNKDMIDPIWEYHHDVGKSITGGLVYRGARLPELQGHYLYGDYVSNKLWALKYDEAKGRVVANRPIKDRGFPIFSFGEDEQGEVYLLTATPTGKGIYWFTK